MPLKATLGQNLKYIREYMRLTQLELAKKAGLKRGVIITAELGNTWPSADNLEAIAKALDTTPFYLLMNPEERAIWDAKASEQPSTPGLSEFVNSLSVNELEGILALKRAFEASKTQSRKKGT